MFLIDTHTHIYLDEFDADRQQVVARAKDSGIVKLLLPNVDENTVEPLLHVVSQWEGFCLPMAGLHPTSVDHNTPSSLSWLEDALATGNFIAVGEVGIDLYWDSTHREKQIGMFRYQIGLAVKYDLPLVIHSREATALILDILCEYRGKVRGVMHCFSGTPEEAHHAVEMGFMLGIGGVFTYKKSNLPDIVKSVGLGNVILETDAPYLPPVPYRGKRNEPAYIVLVAEAIARYLSIPVEEVAATTTANAKQLFQI